MPIQLTSEQEYGLVIDRDAMMIANAGSGKTRVLTERYLDLITKNHDNNTPLSPSEIAAITFTNKAAGEMRERILDGLNTLISKESNTERRLQLEEIRYDMGNAIISTFHTFYNNILREHADLVGLPYNFSIISEIDERILAMDIIEKKISEFFNDIQYKQVIMLYSPKGISELFMHYYKLPSGSIFPDHNSATQFLSSARSKIIDIIKCVWEDFINSDSDKLNKFINKASDKVNEITGALNQIGINNEFDNIYRDFIILHNLKDFKIFGNSTFSSTINAQLQDSHYDIKSVNEIESLSLDLTEELHHQTTPLFSIFESAKEDFINRKKILGKISHDDTMTLAYQLLAQNPSVAEIVRERYSHVMIDEFQDTSPAQVKILKPILSLFNTNNDQHSNKLFIVGDPKQSIYLFTGADVNIFLDFVQTIREKNLSEHADNKNILTTRKELAAINNSNLGEMPLKVSFRCSPSIITFVNKVFSEIMHKNKFGGVDYQSMYWGKKGDNEPDNFTGSVSIVASENDSDNKTKINYKACADAANIIKEILDGNSYLPADRASRYRPSEIAILARNKTRLTDISKELTKLNIPNKIVGNKTYYQQIEVQETISYLRFLLDNSSDVDLATLLTSYYHGLDKTDLLSINAESSLIAANHQGLNLLNDTLWDRFEIYCKYSPEKNSTTYIKSLRAYNCLSKIIPLAQRVAPSELISMILRNSDINKYVTSSFNPQKIIRNIYKIIDTARQIQTSSFFDLSGYVEALFQKVSLGEEEEESEVLTEDSVHLMSIHQSKGLDFKVVLYENSFDRGAEIKKNSPFAIHNGYLALKTQNAFIGEIPTAYESPLYTYFKDLELERIKEEEKRIAYVACTRAIDHLIIHFDLSKCQNSINRKNDSKFTDYVDSAFNIYTLFENLSSTEQQANTVGVKHSQESIQYKSKLDIYNHGAIYSEDFDTRISLFTSNRFQVTQALSDAISLPSKANDQTKTYELLKSKAIKLRGSKLKSTISGRMFFPTNLTLAEHSDFHYTVKYILGFHEMDYFLEKLSSKGIVKISNQFTLTNKISNSRTEWIKPKNKNITPTTDIYDLNNEKPLLLLNNLSLPTVAIGKLVHSAIENIAQFLETRNMNIYSISTVKVKKWMQSSGLKILEEYSGNNLINLSEKTKLVVSIITKLLQQLLQSSHVDTNHLLKGQREIFLYKAIGINAEDNNDILGGRIDLYHIDEEQRIVTIYDWKTISTAPPTEPNQEHLFQLKCYLLLLYHLPKTYNNNDYRYEGRLVYMSIPDIGNTDKGTNIALTTKITILEPTIANSIEAEILSIVNQLDTKYYHEQLI